MKRLLLLLLAVSVFSVLGGAIGAYLMHRSVMSQLAMSELVNDLSVLGYLESGQAEDANRFLRRQVEIHIATIERSKQSGSAGSESDNSEKWIERYGEISESYPPMAHDYDPEIREIVDAAIERVRNDRLKGS